MRKIGVLLIAVMFALNTWFIQYSQAFIYTHMIKQIAAKSATWIAGSGFKVPALAVMTSAGTAGVQSWIPLLIPQARVAKIAGTVLMIGGSALIGWGGDKLINWMTAKGYTYDSGQAGTYQDIITPTEGIYYPEYSYSAGEALYTLDSYHLSEAAAIAAANQVSGNVIYIGTLSQSTTAGCPVQMWNSTYWHARQVTVDIGYGNNPRYFYHFFPFVVSGTPYIVEQEFVETSATVLETAINTDLGNNDAVAIAAAQQALEITGQGLDNSTSIIHSNATGWATIQEELDASITEAQKNAIEADVADEDEWAASVGLTAAVPQTIDAADVQNAVIAALTAKGLSKTEIQQAMEDAIAAKADVFSGAETIPDAIAAALEAAGLTADAVDAVEMPVAPVPTEPGDLPDKSLITTVIEGFIAGLSALPVVSMLTDLEIDAGGNSSITISIPAFVGGDSQDCTIDFADWSAQFQFMGSILLMLCGIRWTIWLFK